MLGDDFRFAYLLIVIEGSELRVQVWNKWGLVEDGLNIPTIASEDWGSGYKV
jgi:hypothetical protein